MYLQETDLPQKCNKMSKETNINVQKYPSLFTRKAVQDKSKQINNPNKKTTIQKCETTNKDDLLTR